MYKCTKQRKYEQQIHFKVRLKNVFTKILDTYVHSYYYHHPTNKPTRQTNTNQCLCKTNLSKCYELFLFANAKQVLLLDSVGIAMVDAVVDCVHVGVEVGRHRAGIAMF